MKRVARAGPAKYIAALYADATEKNLRYYRKAPTSSLSSGIEPNQSPRQEEIGGLYGGYGIKGIKKFS